MPCSGTSCSTRPRRPDVAQTVCVIPRRSKCVWLRGSLTRAIAFGTPVAVLGDLGDDDVVLVVARDREDDLRRPCDPGALEDVDLGRVAQRAHDRPELGLELLEPLAALLDEGHLVAHAEERARDVRADLPAARDDRVHQLRGPDRGRARTRGRRR